MARRTRTSKHQFPDRVLPKSGHPRVVCKKGLLVGG